MKKKRKYEIIYSFFSIIDIKNKKNQDEALCEITTQQISEINDEYCKEYGQYNFEKDEKKGLVAQEFENIKKMIAKDGKELFKII